MTQPEALRLADMLENNYPLEPEAEEAAAGLRRLHEENERLRQALAQPQEWKHCRHCGFQYRPPKEDKWHPLSQPELMDQTSHDTAPPKREWVWLTDDEIHEMTMKIRTKNMGVVTTKEIFREAEAKSKEKNT